MSRTTSSGITQLEMMISLVVMGMIAVLLANVLNYNRQTIERFQSFSVTADELLVQHKLRAWVEQMPLGSKPGAASASLEGDDVRLRFHTLVFDGSFWPARVVDFTVELRSLQDKKVLAVQGRGLDPSQNEYIVHEWDLAQDVDSIRFTYFGRMAGSSQKGWQTTWSETGYLPDLVKLEWDNQDGTPAPPLTLLPGKEERQRYMSLSSLVPPE